MHLASCHDFSSMSFEIDLVAAAEAQLSFLRRVHAAGISLRTPTSENVYRYTNLWITLLRHLNAAGTLRSADLAPPLDIAWLWHCHRLAPRAYTKAYGELDCPKGAFTSTDEGCQSFARTLWEALYPDENFFETKATEFSTYGQWIAAQHVRNGMFVIEMFQNPSPLILKEERVISD